MFSRTIALVFSFLTSLFFSRMVMALGNDSFVLLLDAEALGGYSKVTGKNGVGSTHDSWSVSPNLKLNDSLDWINLYSGSYDHLSQVTAQEEGGRQTETAMSHSLSTALKWGLTKSWSLRPLFFVDWVFVDETNDESLGDGLYDYRDLGGGIESTWTPLNTKTAQDAWRIGFRTFDRQYPNYRSLLSQVLPGNQTPETDEKDFDGYKINLSLDATRQSGWSWGSEAILLYKDFADKRTIDLNGIRQSDTRHDWLGYFNGHASHPLTKNLRLRLDGQFSLNLSNLDFYDTRNTITLADDNFIKDYFDYTSFTVKPSLTYSTALAKDKTLAITASYAFHIQHYPERKAQDAAGVYRANDQEDTGHTFSSRLAYPVAQSFSWVTTGSYTIADSNQKFERFYLYSYDRWNVLSGLSFKY